MSPKYPHIKVQLVGMDGNVFFILGRCQKEMKKHGCTKEEIDEFVKEATSSDYDHALMTCINYFEIF